MRLDKLTSGLEHEVGMSDGMTIRKEGIRELNSEEIASVAGGTSLPCTPYGAFIISTIFFH